MSDHEELVRVRTELAEAKAEIQRRDEIAEAHMSIVWIQGDGEDKVPRNAGQVEGMLTELRATLASQAAELERCRSIRWDSLGQLVALAMRNGFGIADRANSEYVHLVAALAALAPSKGSGT